MANKSVKGYAELYDSPEDIDLWTAGITERPLPQLRRDRERSGVRDGAARPRDQPPGALQVRRAAPAGPQQVEGRLLPLRSLALLRSARLRQIVIQCPS